MKSFSTEVRPSVGVRTRRTAAPTRRLIADLLAPLDHLAKDSPNLIVSRDARFDVKGESYSIPRYQFIGPKSGDAPTRLAIFAGIHGDEPESAYAAVRFLSFLEDHPEMAAGYFLTVYPLCNPTGFEDNTRASRRGKDLNREFWKGSVEPEVGLLQTELVGGAFHGIISLHIDDTCDGFYGIVGGRTLTRHLIGPALKAADAFLPLDQRALIDGFPAENSVLRESFPGVLCGPPRVRPRPFEIVLEAPKNRPAYLTEWAFVAALESVLTNYRKFIAYARHL
jgi:murein peptide amidase A